MKTLALRVNRIELEKVKYETRDPSSGVIVIKWETEPVVYYDVLLKTKTLFGWKIKRELARQVLKSHALKVMHEAQQVIDLL